MQNDLLSPDRNVLAEMLRNYVAQPASSPWAPPGMAGMPQQQAQGGMTPDQKSAAFLKEISGQLPEMESIGRRQGLADQMANARYEGGDAKDSGRFLAAPPAWGAVAPVLSQMMGLYGQNKVGKEKAGMNQNMIAAALRNMS